MQKEVVNGIDANGCNNYESYLGLLAMVGRAKYKIFQGIKERIWQKIQNWKNIFLSKAGKEIMIKAVLQAVPTYSMSVFRLPKKLCNDLEAIMARFWWKQGKNESGIHWKRWEFLGESKAVGSLGFRDIENFNKAVLAKQGWRLMKMEDSLVAKIYKEKYFKNETFTEAKLGMMPSFIWRSLWSVQEVVKNGERWRVGDGKEIRIWDQK